MTTAERRRKLKEILIAIAERSIEKDGIVGIKARELAAEAGCSVGAIYNVLADLDDLVLAVNERTLAMMKIELARAAQEPLDDALEGKPRAVTQMVRLALAYLHFALAHRRRWHALFDHQLPEGKALPNWYAEQRQRMFSFIEEPLRDLQPALGPDQFTLLARSVFSAVHGIVLLGLEEKLGTVSVLELEKQITVIVTALGRGFSSRGTGGGS